MINAISEPVCLRTQKNIQIHCWKTNISAFELSVCDIRKLMQANLRLIIFCQENKYIFLAFAAQFTMPNNSDTAET